ncbi:hypothetical protein Slin15195_G115890 [Septoria linicola]|uniref:Uncharacterized protein n=1 Tax=Septoria linicola TaxID=215465 RepID=A0A9Q9B4U8_9PEZI|nr:hypothetical protein Slin14017_G092910 [Septoria linicola]USW58270.1 hypothetical protein Slin15195_G115890 [Septoria linicola]
MAQKYTFLSRINTSAKKEFARDDLKSANTFLTWKACFSQHETPYDESHLVIALTTMMPTPQPQSPLLALPGELRNKIYHLALVRHSKIRVTETGYERSGLIATCKQTRRECLRIFYHENQFRIPIPRFSAMLLTKFVKHLDGIDFGVDPARNGKEVGWQAGVNCYVTPSPMTPSWLNLLRWCQLIHEGVLPDPKQTADGRWDRGDRRTDWLVIAGIHGIVRQSKERNWEEVKGIVEGFRAALAAVDGRWLEDEERDGK